MNEIELEKAKEFKSKTICMSDYGSALHLGITSEDKVTFFF